MLEQDDDDDVFVLFRAHSVAISLPRKVEKKTDEREKRSKKTRKRMTVTSVDIEKRGVFSELRKAVEESDSLSY